MDADVVARIKKEYVEGNDSLRALAKRYDLPTHTTVGKIAKREDWKRQRETFRTACATKTIEKTASRMARLVEKVMDAIEKNLEGKLDPQSLKQITGAMKDVRDLQVTELSAVGNDEVGVVMMPQVMTPTAPPEDTDE